VETGQKLDLLERDTELGAGRTWSVAIDGAPWDRRTALMAEG
jgi:hypothetical protein